MATKRRTNKPSAPRCLMVPYYRVSTDRQGVSGLGLDAQKTIVERLANQRGCAIPKEFIEVETGKIRERPELIKAIEHARRIGATLVVAKLDRLARNTRFLLELLESGVDVMFGDLPEIPAGGMGEFLITQMASVATLEARLTSERTKAALAAYKARGGKFGVALHGKQNLTPEARRKGLETLNAMQTERAREEYAEVIPIIKQLRDDGMSYEAIANELNRLGEPTRSGRPWQKVAVKRVIDRWIAPDSRPKG